MELSQHIHDMNDMYAALDRHTRNEYYKIE